MENLLREITWERPRDCVLWLPGLPKGTSTILDRSPIGNNGTITGATWTKLPSGLWLLDFDGTDDYIDLGSDNKLIGSGGNTITIVAWVHTDVLGISYPTIFGRYDGTPAGQFLFGLRNTDDLAIFAQTGGWKASTYTAVANTWFLAGVTIDNGAGTFVVNDATRGTFTGVSWNASSNTAKLGYGNVNAYLNGGIALVRIYTIALPPGRIIRMYARERYLFGV